MNTSTKTYQLRIRPRFHDRHEEKRILSHGASPECRRPVTGQPPPAAEHGGRKVGAAQNRTLSTPFGSIFHPEFVFGLHFARSALQSVEPGLAVVWCHYRLLRRFQRRPLHPSYVRCSPSMRDATGVDRSPESRDREATRFSDQQLANLLRLLQSRSSGAHNRRPPCGLRSNLDFQVYNTYVRCSPSMKDATRVDRSPESRAREATRFSNHQLANLLRPLCMPATKWERGRRTGATTVRRRRGKDAQRGGAGFGGRKNERRRGSEVVRRRRGGEEKKKKRGRYKLRYKASHAPAVLLSTPVLQKGGDSYCIVGTREKSSDDKEAGDTNMKEGNSTPFLGFGTSSGAGTSEAGPSFQGASNLSNDKVLARMMSRMDMFDTRLNGMESMIADRFQSIEIIHRSLDSRLDTMQGQYQGIASQLQTVIQLLQPHLSPPPEY
ncbi:hypothetical protein JCGZ_03243 [Jatropha curcas]|uniref:Uncharacterized protein n=1 Tax=Jatropha curcas TaxID=180498 RepID=A0A067L1L2_JATCU|nr:hypothetical protein JCGZ_03243 [Jatropha curcas]